MTDPIQKSEVKPSIDLEDPFFTIKDKDRFSNLKARYEYLKQI